MKKKGFPESYDMHARESLFPISVPETNAIVSPVLTASAPYYDVIPDGDKTVVQPGYFNFEGLNVLQRDGLSTRSTSCICF